MPVKLLVCGLLLAPSVTVRVPVRVPTTLGVKLTLMVHFAFPASEVPQVLVCEKSPVVAMPVIESDVLRLFVKVTLVGVLVVPTVRLANVSVDGDNVTSCTPVPLVVMVCGLSLALSLIVTVPDAAPVTVGVKVTEIVHFFPAATEVPHVFVCANGPLVVMLVIESETAPVLVSVTFFVVLVVLTTTFPKVRDVGESETVCAIEPVAKKTSTSANRKKSRGA